MWAEWIAWEIEAMGHSATIQAWDFGPGESFLSQMRQAMTDADATIALYSPDYFRSVWCELEMEAALAAGLTRYAKVPSRANRPLRSRSPDLPFELYRPRRPR